MIPMKKININVAVYLHGLLDGYVLDKQQIEKALKHKYLVRVIQFI